MCVCVCEPIQTYQLQLVGLESTVLQKYSFNRLCVYADTHTPTYPNNVASSSVLLLAAGYNLSQRLNQLIDSVSTTTLNCREREIHEESLHATHPLPSTTPFFPLPLPPLPSSFSPLHCTFIVCSFSLCFSTCS